jgi:hypothetical protein
VAGGGGGGEYCTRRTRGQPEGSATAPPGHEMAVHIGRESATPAIGHQIEYYSGRTKY